MNPRERIEAVYKEQLLQVRDLERRQDKRAVFAFVYANMTKNIFDCFERAAFKDEEAVATLTEIFAGKYRTALQCYDKGEGCVPPWKTVFETFRNHKTTVVDELIISMYVHISYDLPFSLHEVREKLGRTVHVSDYHLVNDLLEETTDHMQDLVSERFSYRLYLLDRLLKTKDEVLTNYGIRLMRGMAWYNHLRIPYEPGLAEALHASTRVHIKLALKGPYLVTAILLKVFRLFMNLLRRWPPQELEEKAKKERPAKKQSAATD